MKNMSLRICYELNDNSLVDYYQTFLSGLSANILEASADRSYN